MKKQVISILIMMLTAAIKGAWAQNPYLPLW